MKFKFFRNANENAKSISSDKQVTPSQGLRDMLDNWAKKNPEAANKMSEAFRLTDEIYEKRKNPGENIQDFVERRTKELDDVIALGKLNSKVLKQEAMEKIVGKEKITEETRQRILDAVEKFADDVIKDINQQADTEHRDVSVVTKEYIAQIEFNAEAIKLQRD